jgi:hypothetical protein
MKLPYREGTWFGVPLRQGGFAVGLVARATAKGRVILCYFFGPRRTAVPALSELERLKPSDAIWVARVGDLALIRGQWPIIGQTESWKRCEWPLPAFVRRDPLSGKAWRVFHSDTDPSLIDREEPETYESSLENDGVYGAGAVELVLTKLLTQETLQ